MKKSNWFKKNLRRIHILYVSPEWVKERGKNFDARNYAENLKKANVACIELYAKDHHGYCYYESSTGRKYPIDILGEMTRECHERGIKTIAYFSVCFDNFASGTYPEWLYVDKEGNFRENKFTKWLCLNSPYKEYALNQIKEIASQYPVDGFWLDIVPTTWFEFAKIGWWGEIYPFCHCIYCRKKYKGAYGKDIPLEPNQEQLLEGYRFMVDGVKSFLEKAYRTIRRYCPNAIVTYNGAGSPHDPLNNADFMSIEGHAPNYFHQSFLARCGKASKKPMEILSAGALSGWDGWDQKPLELLRLESSIGIAHGIGFTFGQQLYPDGQPQKSDFRTLGRLFSYIKKVEEYCVDQEGVSDIGLFLSLKSWDAPHLGVEALAETEGLHQALLCNHFQYDIVSDPANFKQYPLIIIGNQLVLSDRELKSIRGYVEAGGKLIVTGLTSLYDEKGEKRKDFGLRDLMGVSFLNEGEYPFAYLKSDTTILVEERMVEVEIKSAKPLLNFFYPETTWTKGTTILWGNPPPDKGNFYPCIVQRKHGKGECVYVAFPMGSSIRKQINQRSLKEYWLENLFVKIVSQLLPIRILETNAQEGIEVVFNKIQKGYAIHLVNHYTGIPGILSSGDKKNLFSDVKIELQQDFLGKVKRVYCLPEKKDAECHSSGVKLVLNLPPFSTNLIIILEKQQGLGRKKSLHHSPAKENRTLRDRVC